MSFTAKITADITKFEQNIDKAVDSTNRLEKTVSQKLTNMGDSFVSVGKKASVLSAALVAAGGKAFMMAADFEDAIGATSQIFSDNADIVRGWADTLGTEYGIAKKEALEYSNLMGSMLINIGKLTEEQAARQSAKLIELAGDLTAMYGGRTQDAVRALMGALKGNNTMLDNYGMAVNDALVKTRAFEMGLSDGTGELSLQARQAATLALIYEQTTAAQGQAAREADGASGSMRALTTEVKNLSTELGQVLIPVITPVVAGIRDMVAGLRTLSPEMQTLVVTTGAIAAAAGPLLIAIGKILTALPKIKVAIAALSGPIAAIGAAMVVAVVNFGKNIEALKTDWDYLLNHLRTTSAGIGDVLTGNLSGWWGKVRTTWGKNIDYLRDKWNQFIAYFTGDKGLKQSQEGLEAALAANEMTGSAGAIQEVSKSAAIASSSVDNLTTSFKELGKAQETVASIADIVKPKIIIPKEQQASMFDQLFSKSDKGNLVLNPVIEPTIDTESLISKMYESVKSAMGYLGEGIKVMTIDMTSTVTDIIDSAFSGSADAIANKENVVASLGASILAPLGNILSQLGKMLITTGAGFEALQKMFANPFGGGLGAIAAGVALMALGAAAKAGASAIMANQNKSSGYSSAPSMGNTSPSYGPSEYRGPYQDDFEVTFKIGTNELVGVLNTAEQRRNRI